MEIGFSVCAVLILMKMVDKIQDLAQFDFQENFCIYSGISVSCHFCMINFCMCNVGNKVVFANLDSPIHTRIMINHISLNKVRGH